MKVLALGDTHGRDDWKKVVDADADKIVFIGDYVDSHEKISGDRQARNLKEILAFKRDSPDRVVLLIGNHDYHYLPGVDAQYSGYQGHMTPIFMGLLKGAIEEGLIQACFVADGVLYSHAGISKTWAADNHVDMDSLQEYVNNYFLHNTSKFGFQRLPKGYGYENPYGDNVFQSPLWIRPNSLLQDKLDGYKQVVGHTMQRDGLTIEDGVAFIDTLATTGEYLIIEDGEFSAHKI